MKHVCALFLIFAVVMPLWSCSNETVDADVPEFERIIPEPGGDDLPLDPNRAGSDLDNLRRDVDEHPDDPNVRFAFLVALKLAEMYAEALEQARILGEMEGVNPLKGIAYLNFADIVLHNVPLDAPDRADLVSEAMDGLWIALGWEPESIPAHNALGRLALEAGDYDKAVHHLSIVLTVTEIGYELRTSLAEIFIEREDIDKARAHLVEALLLAEEAEDDDAVRKINGLLRGLG
jgi:tetratricopeptide (TPR) repeat protein